MQWAASLCKNGGIVKTFSSPKCMVDGQCKGWIVWGDKESVIVAKLGILAYVKCVSSSSFSLGVVEWVYMCGFRSLWVNACVSVWAWIWPTTYGDHRLQKHLPPYHSASVVAIIQWYDDLSAISSFIASVDWKAAQCWRHFGDYLWISFLVSFHQKCRYFLFGSIKF